MAATTSQNIYCFHCLSLSAIITLLNGKFSALKLWFLKIQPRHAKDIKIFVFNFKIEILMIPFNVNY